MTYEVVVRVDDIGRPGMNLHFHGDMYASQGGMLCAPVAANAV